MSASTLFPEPTTPSTGPLANLEPHVVWLQRSTQPEAAAARRRVNAWYQDFPDPNCQLAAKLTSLRDYVLDPGVPYVLAVGNHDPFCNDLQLLMAIYGRDWEALVGGRQPLWQDELKFRGFFGIDKGGPPYRTRFSAAAVINGAVLFHHPSTMEWLVFDNPHARVRLPAGLLPTTHRFQALDVSRWGWRPPRPLP